MKKIATVILATVLLTSSFTYGAYASNRNVKVNVDNKEISFTEASPYIDSNGRVLVPLKFVSESIGAQVEWDSVKKEAIIIKDGKEIKVGDEAVISSGRTMVPVRFVSEALGAKVAWDKVTYTVVITTDGSEPVVSVESAKPQVELTVAGVPVELYNQFRPNLKKLHDDRLFAKDNFGNDYTLPESVLNPKGIMTERQILEYIHESINVNSRKYKEWLATNGQTAEFLDRTLDNKVKHLEEYVKDYKDRDVNFLGKDKGTIEFLISKNILTNNNICNQYSSSPMSVEGIEIRGDKYRCIFTTVINNEAYGQKGYGFLVDYGEKEGDKPITTDTFNGDHVSNGNTEWMPIPSHWN